jgi:hypothetical protein
VATDWGPAVQTGIGAGAALLGGLLTAWYQARAQERTERIRRRERAAEVAAAAFEFYLDTRPDRLSTLGDHDDLLEVIDELRARYSVVRTQLVVLTASYPSSKVRELAGEVPALLADRLGASLSYARARLGAGDVELAAAEAEAEAKGRQTLKAISDLTTAIQLN